MITAPAGRVFPPACSGTHFPALKRQGLAAGDPCSLTSGRTGTSFLPARTRPGQRLVLIRFTPIICAFPPFVNPPTFLKESRQRTFPSRGLFRARSSLSGRDWLFLLLGFPLFYAFPGENPGKELFLRGVFLVPDLSWAAAIGYFFFWGSLYSTLFPRESRQRTFPSRGFLVPRFPWEAAIGYFFFWVSLYSTLFPERTQAKDFPSRGFSGAKVSLDGRDWLFLLLDFPLFYVFPERIQAKNFSFAGFFWCQSLPWVAAIGFFRKEKGETPVCLPWIGWILFFRRSAGPLLPWNAPCGDAPTVPRSSRGVRSWRKRTCRDSGRR